ncbi:MAG TPA: GTP-binding protein [Stellaceae bacterium]|nr:GTP-binding protein [Stellaceae bacterium]
MIAMAPENAEPALPVTLLTGFLGSGKTTLLRRALASPALNDTAVIVNEIGEIAIDHYLVDLVEGDVLELPGGCLCCAVREDLAASLRGLIDRRDAGELRPFRRVVIETSGLADPGPILYTLGADPMLDARLRLACVVTVVDAVSGAATLDRFAEAARQAAVADALVVSKTDLVPFGAALTTRLDALNPGAARVVAATADPGAVLFGQGGTAARGPHPCPLPLAGEGVEMASPLVNPPPRAGEGCVGASPLPQPADPHATHTHGIDTFALILDGRIEPLPFAQALGGLAQARGYDLLRVKGLVEFAERPGRPVLVQAAQHAMFAPEWLDAWPDADRRSRLVFIVHGIPRAEILALFAFASPTILGT